MGYKDIAKRRATQARRRALPHVREQKKEYMRQYREKNKAQIKEQQKGRQRVRAPDYMREYMRDYRQTPKYKAYQKKYQLLNAHKRDGKTEYAKMYRAQRMWMHQYHDDRLDIKPVDEQLMAMGY